MGTARRFAMVANARIAGLARCVATVGGVGYLPVAPGTAGTLVGIPVAWMLAGVSFWTYLACLGVLVGIAIWAVGAADQTWARQDCQRIVVDELVGYLVTMAPVARNQATPLVVGFVLFRVLDIVKPPPARYIERHFRSGTGVVLDDVVAGLYGAALLWLGFRFFALWR
ncbi:MAG: phosphatidylglycerophosphatase A [Pseudomonadota bacterium]